ncbi:MAG TPA: OmpA family protein [Kofleriaceae bacterium]|nr:OmpA family protein [Kofleriaceae bacterium]
MKPTTLILVLVVAAGCSHDKPKVAKPTQEVAKTPEPTTDKPAPTVEKDTQVSPGLAVSGDLASLCNIKATLQTKTNPTFDYDKDELTPEDRTVLDQLATCLTTGALKGKAVALIGRADPRGTEEYNLGLGSRRAASVSQYLGRLGVTEPQMSVSTRGALEATGTDEASWKQDRRVDVQLRTN